MIYTNPQLAMLNDVAISGTLKVRSYSESAKMLIAHGELEIVGRVKGYIRVRIPPVIELPGVAPWRGEPFYATHKL